MVVFGNEKLNTLVDPFLFNNIEASNFDILDDRY